MAQTFLTTSSIVVINFMEDKNIFYLMNKSFIRTYQITQATKSS